jgi:alkaline phosphatase
LPCINCSPVRQRYWKVDGMRINKKGFIGGCFIVLVTAFAAGAASSTRMESTPSAAPRPAKYVILMIGDGMGAWHVDAAAKFRGRPPAMTSLEHHGYMTTFMRNATDKSGPYAFEYWDDGSQMGAYDPGQGGHTPWQKPSDPAYPQHNATDSAASATAILSGRKTVRYALNVEAKEQGYAPSIGLESIRYHRTIVDIAESLGMATGVVTSVNFNHATPAAAVVKTPYRKNHGEKTRQLLESSMEVIMGAGHPMYDDDGRQRPPTFKSWSRNKGPYLSDADGRALFAKAAANYNGRRFIDSRADFDDLADGDRRFRGHDLPKQVFGLARVADTLQFNRSRPKDPTAGTAARLENVPSLAMMTRGALAVLSQAQNGFWLLVEGGAIDWAGHTNDMQRMLEELSEFDAAVQTVIQWVNDGTNDAGWNNTLVIVTADHETGYLQPVGDRTGMAVIEHQCWGIDCNGWHEHTNLLVPIYAQGVGAKSLKAAFDGDYRDNTDIFKTMLKALGLKL